MIEYDKKVLIIAGPSASGKSEIAIKLAKDIDGYIVNADSRQIYKYLNIGTAKPTEEEIKNSKVRHFLYSIVDPKENFTLFEYQRELQKILNTEKGIPILVGGSGLYIDSIVFNYNLQKDNLQKDLSSFSLEQLQKKAKKYLDSMTESDRKNKHRLIRVIQRKGHGKSKGKELDNMYFVIDIEKEELNKRVEQRIEDMFKNNLLEENRQLLSMGYTYNDKGMKSIGYKEFKPYFDGEVSLDTVKKRVYKNTLSYIKRQRTWFRRNSNAIWESNYKNIYDLASNFIKEV